MKYTIIAILLIITMGCYINRVEAGNEMKSRENLRLVSDESKKSAEALLVAIEQGSRDSINQHMKELVTAGKIDLVASLLDDPSEAVKQEAARSLAKQKTRKVATALLAAMSKLNVAVRGGDEAQILRAETKQTFREVLSSVIDSEIKEEWTEAETARHIENALKKMRD
ncbi:MAG: hypothetical protein HC904_04500 [Blastochloris sp.]|nr:hypothetical protein [Blastochloris sp.]